MVRRCLLLTVTSRFPLTRSNRYLIPRARATRLPAASWAIWQVRKRLKRVRCAMIFGSVMASFNVEEFGTERVKRLTHAEINDRFRAFKRMTHFDEIPFEAKLS